jgi:hypothetical protein
MALSAAIASAAPGDLHWLVAGTYQGPFTLDRAGTAANPIVWRAMPSARVTLRGQINMRAADNWLWGLELTDLQGPIKPDVTGGGGGPWAQAPGSRIINCVIHETGVGIGGSGEGNGPRHVYYGNILYGVGANANPDARGYAMYVQNHYPTMGWKYIVDNILLDQDDMGALFPYLFHAYGEGVQSISGFHLEGNVFRRGRWLLGGRGTFSSHHNIIRRNLFHQSSPQIGYQRATQAEVVGNYIGRGGLLLMRYWGAAYPGDASHPGSSPPPIPNVYTDNVIVNGYAWLITAGGEPPERTAEGAVGLDVKDAFDRNRYHGTFESHLQARIAGVNYQVRDGKSLADWRAHTASAGKTFDATSTHVTTLPSNYVEVRGNDYEPGVRAHVVIYNWSGAATIAADLSTVFPAGTPFTVHLAKDSFGVPLVTGTVGTPVALPMTGKEFEVFLVRRR